MQYFFPLFLSGWKGWLLFFICSLLFSLLLMEVDVRLRKRAAYKRMRARVQLIESNEGYRYFFNKCLEDDGYEKVCRLEKRKHI
jgi:hypothetical protein